MRYAVHIPQFYHSFGQKSQRPPTESLRRLVARKGDQMRLYRAVYFLLRILPLVWTSREYGFQSFFNHLLANALHRVYRHTQRFANLRVLLRESLLGLVRFDQYGGPGDYLRGPFSRFRYLFEGFPLFIGQSYYVLLHQSAPYYLCYSSQTDVLYFGSLFRLLRYPLFSA